jgi:hypothetical protein
MTKFWVVSIQFEDGWFYVNIKKKMNDEEYVSFEKSIHVATRFSSDIDIEKRLTPLVGEGTIIKIEEYYKL